MLYRTLSSLPKNVKDNLPHHAQEIYKSAFNNARKEYSSPEDRKGDDTADETAHKVAWSAVKQKYKKNADGEWREKS